MGRALAGAWTACGHTCVLGSRDADRGRDWRTASASVRGGAITDAAEGADIVVMAVPWKGVENVLEITAPHVKGKVLLDCTNPLSGAHKPLAVGRSTSGAEEMQQRVPDCRVRQSL
jgi:8-hydroxy-5-deazaflavin:NADPH oxidoreductase